MDDEALGGDAGLAVVDAAGFDCIRYGGVEIGGGEDDVGVGAAEFEDGLLDEPAGLGGDGAAGGLGAGEGDGDDAGVVEEVFYLAGFDEEGLEDAAGKAGAAHEGFNRQGTLRHVGCVLQEADVAGHERGGEETEDLPEGEVPGHDGEDDAEGVVADVAIFLLRAVGLLGDDALGSEDAGRRCRRSSGRRRRSGDLGAGRDEGFAHLGGHGDGELFDVGFEERGEAAHPEDALVERLFGVSLSCARLRWPAWR